MNSFITRLANDSSKRSIANVKAFCENSVAMFDGALSADLSAFTPFAVAQPVSKLHGFVPCTTTQEASTSPTKPGAKHVPLPIRKPATVASAASADSGPTAPAAPVLISR